MVAFENAGVLRLDVELDPGRAPTAVLTLTTRTQLSGQAYRDAVAVFWRAFRRAWGTVEYCGFVEWTTGKGSRSGGVRRQHEHFLLKDVQLPDGAVYTRAPGSWKAGHGRPRCTCGDVATCVECWTRCEWKALTGAWVVNVSPLRTQAGATAYLALHHEKRSQQPPAGWRGKRFRPSRRYFNRPVAELRAEVRLRDAERLAELNGRDPAAVRPRSALDAFTAALVPHQEAQPDLSPGTGYGDAEFDALATVAARGRIDETDVERAERIYAETTKLEARRRIGRRRSTA